MIPAAIAPVPAQVPTSFAVFWSMLGKIVGQQLAGNPLMHADVTIVIKAGKPELVRLTQTLLANQLPR